MPSDAMFTEVIELVGKIDKFEAALNKSKELHDRFVKQLSDKPPELLSQTAVNKTVAEMQRLAKQAEDYAKKMAVAYEVAFLDAEAKKNAKTLKMSQTTYKQRYTDLEGIEKKVTEMYAREAAKRRAIDDAVAQNRALRAASTPLFTPRPVSPHRDEIFADAARQVHETGRVHSSVRLEEMRSRAFEAAVRSTREAQMRMIANSYTPRPVSPHRDEIFADAARQVHETGRHNEFAGDPIYSMSAAAKRHMNEINAERTRTRELIDLRAAIIARHTAQEAVERERERAAKGIGVLRSYGSSANIGNLGNITRTGQSSAFDAAPGMANLNARNSFGYMVGSGAKVGTVIDAAASAAFMGGMGNVGAGLYMLERLAYASGHGKQSLMELGEKFGMVEKGASKSAVAVQEFGDGIIRGIGRAVPVVASLAATFTAMYKAVDSDRALAKLSTLLDVSDRNELRSAKQGVYSALGKTGAEFGRAIEDQLPAAQLALSSGIAQQDLPEFMRAVNNLATAGDSSTSEAVDAITGIFDAYGKGAYSAARASDILFKTIDVGKGNLPELLKGIGKISSTAANAGVSLEGLTAMVAVLTRTNVRTDTATTRVNRLITDIVAPDETAQKKFDALGLDNRNAFATGEGSEFFKKLRKVTGGSKNIISQLFGDERGSAAATAITEGLDSYISKLDAITTATDASVEASERARLSFGGFVDSLSATAGNKFKEAGQGMLTALGEVTGMYGPLSEQTAGLITTVIGALDAIVTPTLAAIGVAVGTIAKGVEGVLSGILAAVSELDTAILHITSMVEDLKVVIYERLLGETDNRTLEQMNVADTAHNKYKTARDRSDAYWASSGKSFGAIGDRFEAWLYNMEQWQKRVGLRDNAIPKGPADTAPKKSAVDKVAEAAAQAAIDAEKTRKEAAEREVTAINEKDKADNIAFDRYMKYHKKQVSIIETLEKALDAVDKTFNKLFADNEEYFNKWEDSGDWRKQRVTNARLMTNVRTARTPEEAQEAYTKLMRGVEAERAGMQRDYGMNDRRAHHIIKERYYEEAKTALDEAEGTQGGIITAGMIRAKAEDAARAAEVQNNPYMKQYAQETARAVKEGLEQNKLIADIKQDLKIRIDAVQPADLANIVERTVKEQIAKRIDDINNGKKKPDGETSSNGSAKETYTRRSNGAATNVPDRSWVPRNTTTPK